MSALQKLKAYFGMVPAEDIDDYDSDDDYRRDYRMDGYRSEYLDDNDGGAGYSYIDSGSACAGMNNIPGKAAGGGGIQTNGDRSGRDASGRGR